MSAVLEICVNFYLILPNDYLISHYYYNSTG